MAITLLAVHPGTQYPWGYQVRFTLTAGAGTRDINEDGVWPSAPTEAQINARVAECIARRVAEGLLPPERRDVDRLNDIERDVLKGILQVNATSDHVASLTITAANKAGIQARLAIVKDTLIDGLTAMRQS